MAINKQKLAPAKSNATLRSRAKREKRQQFNQLADRMMKLSGQAAEQLKTKARVEELEKCARETWEYSNPAKVTPLHLKGSTHYVFERCLLTSCGLNALISTGPIGVRNERFAEDPAHYFNAVINSFLNRVNQAMAAETNDPRRDRTVDHCRPTKARGEKIRRTEDQY
ncbi:hypothetical protein D5R89_19810 [Vibrio cholerae]|nr:hypothetical protein D5R89_19810 [Vibrio cholerae]